MSGNDFIQATMTVQMQVIYPSLEMHRKNQSHQSQVVITVQVADENMIDSVEIGLQTHELHLRSFTTVNQEVAILYFNKLRRRMTSVCG